jgi:hypothetical protein
MRNIAINSVDIGHIEGDEDNNRFFRVASIMTVDEIINNLSIMKEFSLVVEDNAEGGLIDNNSIMDKPIHTFFLLKKVEQDNADDREAAKQQCKSVMFKILSRMRRDWISDNEGKTEIGVRNIEFGQWTYQTFGPILNNCIGISVSFIAPNSVNTAYNGNDWRDS